MSKKQLQGLFSKAQKIGSIPPGKLATLEAIILKRPTKERSNLPATTPLYEKDETTRKLIRDILNKYPEHKRVIFLQAKFENNEIMQPSEITELQRFARLLK